MSDPSPEPRTSGKAVASFVLGALALVLNLFAALPALIVGYVSLREINHSDGRLTGRGLSVAAMALGAFVCLADVIGVAALIIVNLRLTAARTECENNLRQMGMATTMYLHAQKTFPPGTIPNATLPPDERLSWIASLLPYYIELDVERRKINKEKSFYYPIAEGIDRTKAWDDEANRQATERIVRAFLCPGHPRFGEEPPPGPTHYLGVAGLGANAAELPLTDPNCGFFGYDRKIMPDDITAGISYTMLATETGWHNGPWARGGYATVRGLDPAEELFAGKGIPFGGLHPGIVNMLFVDGRVEHFNTSAPPDQFTKWATLRRGADADENR
jgi:prepilin-type processing-associated H-X9-DG protein